MKMAIKDFRVGEGDTVNLKKLKMEYPKLSAARRDEWRALREQLSK